MMMDRRSVVLSVARTDQLKDAERAEKKVLLMVVMKATCWEFGSVLQRERSMVHWKGIY